MKDPITEQMKALKQRQAEALAQKEALLKQLAHAEETGELPEESKEREQQAAGKPVTLGIERIRARVSVAKWGVIFLVLLYLLYRLYTR